MILLLNILIDVLRGESTALDWVEAKTRPAISVITWIEVLVGCRGGETERVEPWLASFVRLSLDHAIATTTVELRLRHGLKVPEAIILATATCHGLTLATRKRRDIPLSLSCVVLPYQL